ncbi:glutaminyl-peptide cyclotransferase [Aquimarina sp. ERC-38]|uniref:glutaminyl-peptide cyclotransferase n=1 Tax=Aquimarina sp. ERC-38 TaxID=2949996 RepID=UPI0022469178|nr:glutaminyl-peptide cyclotransferase [Aquimarina sp. ERC-38]UZO79875.1 glutaminyl-peptide cyclotransferase [Aquimarina sp. ERC-38]
MDIDKKQTKIQLGEALKASVNNPKNKQIDSVVYLWNDQNTTLPATQNFEKTINTELLGHQPLLATVYYEGKSEIVEKKITVLNDKAPKLYSYKIINTYPHDQEAFVQGLEFKDDTLYESTGQKTKSTLRKLNFSTGEIIKKVTLEDQYFAEGLTIMDQKIYQLTWLAEKGFIYDLPTLKRTGSFAYNQSKQGWGLCNDGTTIYKSDGTEKIWLLDAENLSEQNYIQVTTNKSVKTKFNELEWVNGKIYANTWQKDGIAIINPKNGALEAVINLTGLRDQVTAHPQLDVLNGIAYNSNTNKLYVTGKYWDKLFEIEIVK